MKPYLHILHQPDFFGPEFQAQFLEFFVPFVGFIVGIAIVKSLSRLWRESFSFWN